MPKSRFEYYKRSLLKKINSTTNLSVEAKTIKVEREYQKQGFSVKRLVFLFILVAVFLYTYLADFNIFALVLRYLDMASYLAKHFIVLFLILSFTALSVYYYFTQISHAQVSQRFLAWLKVLSIAFFVSFLVSALIIYFNIYSNKTFDI